MTVLGFPSTSHLLTLAAVMAFGVIPAVEALEPSPVAKTATEQQLIIKAPDATCGYIDGREDQPYTCGDTRQTCAFYFPTSAYLKQALTAPTVSPRSFANAVSGTTSTVIVDSPQIRKGILQSRSHPGPAITPGPNAHPGPYGAVACCDSDVPVCTLQPTACVDNYLHPASVLCTGNCPGDDMTLKCTADMNSQCRLAHVATPIAYFEKPNYKGVNLQRSDNSDQGHLATLDQVVSGWFCAQLETNDDIVSQYNQVSTLEQSKGTIIESIATETSSSGEEDTTETQSAPYWNGPSSPVDLPSVDAGQDQIGFPGNEDCYWVDDYGNCCDPSEGGYYRPKRQLKLRRSQFEEVEMDGAAASTISKLQMVTYVHSTTISRPITTLTPVEPPVKPIVEAIYIVFDTYDNKTDPIPRREAATSHTIVLYTDKQNQTSEMAKPTRSHPTRPRPTTGNKGDSRAGMKAGIAIGAIVFIALVLFVVLRCRSLRKAKRANLVRDAQPGPTRGWST